MKIFSFVLALFFLTIFSLAQAQVPETMSYQGTLSDDTGQPVANGDYSMTFRLYDVSSGGTALWQETQTITVTDGIFNAILGASTPLGLSFDNTYWLSVAVGTGSELDPRIELTASAYSLNAKQVLGTSNVFPADGNVGIGITNPAAKLEVDGLWSIGITGTFPGGSDGRLYAPNGIYSEAGGTDWAHYFTAFGNGDIARFATGTLGEPLDTKVVIKNTGNVGIGLEDPDDLLDVAGIVSSTTGGFKFPDGTIQTTAAGGGTGNGNTLDQAYDQGGPGVGRTITADAGAVEITSDGTAIEASSTGSNTIYSTSDAGGGYAAGFFNASGSGTYGIWAQSSDYDALYASCSSSTNTAIRAIASNGAYAGIFDGSVGIGTSEPAARLEVADYPAATNDPVGIRITNLRSTQDIFWELRAYDSGAGGPYGRFSIFGGNVGGADRLSVTTRGDVGIGTIDPAAKLEVIGIGGLNTIRANSSAGGGYSAGYFTATGSGTYGVWAQSSDYDALYAWSSSSSHAAVRAVSAGTDADAIYADGDIAYTGELYEVVDKKFQENIQPIENAMGQITRLKARTFQLTSNPQLSNMNFSKGKKYGFIAQELEAVFPELVSKNRYLSAENNFEYKGVNYIELIPILVKAVQEQQEVIETLKRQVETLKSQ